LAVVGGGLAVVGGSLAVVGGSLAVEHRGHPVACGLVVLACVRAAVVPVGELSTYAAAYVAPDSCSVALGRAAIAVVSGAIVRVSVLIRR
jgi:hypothetical protein